MMKYELRIELRRSNASGSHLDKRTRRKRTRQAQKQSAIHDQGT